jgi:hypothetical protein
MRCRNQEASLDRRRNTCSAGAARAGVMLRELPAPAGGRSPPTQVAGRPDQGADPSLSCVAAGVAARPAWRGMDGQRPDAEPAARDGDGGTGVKIRGDRRKVGDQQGCLLVRCQVVRRPQQHHRRPGRPDTASSSPKSVSAEIITSPVLAACARIASSGAASMPASATCTASCPAPRNRAAIRGDRFASMSSRTGYAGRASGSS